MRSIVVLDLVLLVVVVVVVIGQIGLRRTARACRSSRAPPACPCRRPRQSLDDRERIEGSLAARLVAGEVSSAATGSGWPSSPPPTPPAGPFGPAQPAVTRRS